LLQPDQRHLQETCRSSTELAIPKRWRKKSPLNTTDAISRLDNQRDSSIANAPISPEAATTVGDEGEICPLL
jgi:hypothetical protein